MELRYGILSTSSIAPRFIAAVREAKAGTVVALSSRTLEKAKEKARLWEIPKAYAGHEALLQDEDVNIIYISNVNAQHYVWARAALLKGKHVVCEKPCTTSAEQTAELFDLAAERGLFFMEAEKMLLLPVIARVRQEIRQGTLGEIAMADLSHSFSAGYNSWLFDASAGGGPLLSSGIYAVQLMLWLFGPIAHLGGKSSQLENGVEWQYIVTGQTESGVLFSIKNSTRGVLDNTARIFGTKGYVEIPEYWKARKAIFHISGEAPRVVEIPCVHELSYEAAHIQECMDAGLLTSPVVTREISVQGICALEQIKAGW